MTTAHRPTFDPAKGKDALRGPAYHQRLLPAHTFLKHRQQGQGGAADAGQRDLRAELLRAEVIAKRKRSGATGQDADEDIESINESRRPQIAAGDDEESLAVEEDGDEDPDAKRRRLILEEARDIDADSDGGGSDSEESEEEEDEEDEEAELMRELAKIKAERAAAKAEEERQQAAKEAEEREVEIARGNPLLNGKDFNVNRRWDDDVVFKNQGRGTEEKGKRKEFVNDLLRSDFHKRFMVSTLESLTLCLDANNKLDEICQVMERLWSQDSAKYASYSFFDSPCLLKGEPRLIGRWRHAIKLLDQRA